MDNLIRLDSYLREKLELYTTKQHFDNDKIKQR
jgi:hypothetical protein